ncbi:MULTISPECIES: hypothetical protein [Mesorhizobium]|uniref:hypothetical protein n=1 Tax=Mesorhizobium TaxID=68287 RepID=UPI0007A95641|nr:MULTISPECIES: hypothetical protein [Mesorhizobium]AMX93679.1 hypothetical protein A4R28_11500 [Mesorhizobium ciceri]MDF3208374.1 hypothetical protein [Mesorhizobium sp. LMG15046]MDF3229055.1 hypothetical protein [Mesorhizobium sp. DSM 30133]RUU22169.1 hypothetical protein EOC84_03395 [Mesorhizobium sp. Primo-B]RUU37921.1 hypothetical protein EOC83_16820 [Mesorhizobium sp. Primo-A]
MSTAPESFFNAYLATALWSSTDGDGNPLDAKYGPEDIDGETLDGMLADCNEFYRTHSDAIQCNGVTFGPDFDQDGRAGHDFWLTRCGHGSGFWDGDWPEPQASRLTDAAKAFGNVDLYIGDDGKVHA